MAGPSKEDAAKAHYLKGAQLYRANDFAGAWLEFTSAYQLLPRTELLFNMARCEVKLGRPKEALEHFRLYLLATPQDPDAEGIRKEMAALQVEVDRQSRLDEERRREDPPPPPVRRASRPWPVYGTIAGAGTVLFGVISVALLGSVSSQYNYLEGYCAPVCTAQEVLPLQRQAAAGYAFLGLTAAGAVTTAALLTWELRRPRDRVGLSPVFTPQPRALGLGWRF